MTQTYYAVLTEVGEAKLANATALGTPLQLTRMAVGDGGGSVPVPNRSAKNLVGERHRANLNTLQKDPLNSSQVIAELVLPETVGGWWIREIGLFDAAGDLIAYSNAPETYKPQMAEGSARTQVVRMVLLVSSVAAVELKVDPSVVLATREFVLTTVAAELAKLDQKLSVRYTTTGNITLSGLAVQTNGDWPAALSAGDRILVKNQTSAKDNGLWAAATGAWTRTADADLDAKVTPGLMVPVETGRTLADTVWQLITDAPIVVGTSALAFKDITAGLAPIQSPIFTGTAKAPTPAQFNASTQLATTEFVAQALGSMRGVAVYNAAVTLTAADIGRVIRFGFSGYRVTLPKADATLPDGSAMILFNTGLGPVTIACAEGDHLAPGGGTLDTIDLGIGDHVLVIKQFATEWTMIGTGQLPKAAVFSGPNFSTAPQFDTSKRLATTEFVQRAFGGFGRAFAYGTAGQVIPSDRVNSAINLFGTCTSITLPLSSTVPAGSVIHFSTTSLGCAINRQGSEVIFANSANQALSSITIGDGESLTLVSTSFGWIAYGVGALKYASSFSSALAATGYQKLPSGLIWQWGITGPLAAATASTVTYPIAFPSAVHAIQLTYADGSVNSPASRGAPVQVGQRSNTSFSYSHSGSSNQAQHYWLAIGS